MLNSIKEKLSKNRVKIKHNRLIKNIEKKTNGLFNIIVKIHIRGDYKQPIETKIEGICNLLFIGSLDHNVDNIDKPDTYDHSRYMFVTVKSINDWKRLKAIINKAYAVEASGWKYGKLKTNKEKQKHAKNY